MELTYKVCSIFYLRDCQGEYSLIQDTKHGMNSLPQALYIFCKSERHIFAISADSWLSCCCCCVPSASQHSTHSSLAPLERAYSCQRVSLPILAVVLLCLIARLRLGAWLIHKQGSSTSTSHDRRNISTKTATQHLSWNRWVSLIYTHAGTHTRPQRHTHAHTHTQRERERDICEDNWLIKVLGLW